jgi:nucleotide-binding universal stress UspA family protein
LAEEKFTEVAYKTIVTATDGSLAALDAARHAVTLARMSGARLRIIYVINTHIAFHLGAYQQMALDSMQEEGDQAVNEIVKVAKDAGVQDASGVVVSGSPRQVILEWADEQQADLLVVGSHGYSRITYILIGSVAEFVVHHAQCPVLVIRGKEQK